MKRTRKFLASKRLLDRFFLCLWTVTIADDGTKGPRKKRLLRKDGFQFPETFVGMSRARMALRIKEGEA
jgi:hypothetical protein